MGKTRNSDGDALLSFAMHLAFRNGLFTALIDLESSDVDWKACGKLAVKLFLMSKLVGSQEIRFDWTLSYGTGIRASNCMSN
jgi:hypothetical protein